MSMPRVVSGAAIEEVDADGGNAVIACLLLMAAGSHATGTIVLLHAGLEGRDE